jgi:hypothetical protein
MTSQMDRRKRPGLTKFFLLAWAVTVMVSSVIWTAVAGFESRSPEDRLLEIALIYLVIIAVPLALALAMVTVPTVVSMRSVVGRHRVWLQAAGAAAAPFGILLLLAAARVLFAGSEHMRPTLWHDVVAVSRDPYHLMPMLMALMAGGIVMGYGASRQETGAA